MTILWPITAATPGLYWRGPEKRQELTSAVRRELNRQRWCLVDLPARVLVHVWMQGECCLATYAFQRSMSLGVKSWRTWARWQAAEDPRIKIELRAVYSINHFGRQTLEVLVGVPIAVGREEEGTRGSGKESNRGRERRREIEDNRSVWVLFVLLRFWGERGE